MKNFFKAVNENSLVNLNAHIIDDLLFCDDVKCIDVFEKYLSQMSLVDKSLLNDDNLGKLEALEAFFGKSELPSFEGKSKMYKKSFLSMLKNLSQKEMLYELNGSERISFSIDADSHMLNVEYTNQKLCDRKDNSLAISNINDLKGISLNGLQDKYEEYKSKDIPLDSQVEFVLRSYLNTIKVSNSYKDSLENWKSNIIVYGKSEYYLFERDFLLLDDAVLNYFDYLMTMRVQTDLGRDDIVARVILDEEARVALLISKQYFKQKVKNKK